MGGESGVSLSSFVDVPCAPCITIDLEIWKCRFLDKSHNSRVQFLGGRNKADESRKPSGKVFRMRLISHVPFLLALALISASASAQVRSKKDVLILNEVGLSHSLTDVMTQQIVSGVERTTRRDVEFFSESLDLLSLPDTPSLAEARDWLVKKYGGRNREGPRFSHLFQSHRSQRRNIYSVLENRMNCRDQVSFHSGFPDVTLSAHLLASLNEFFASINR